MQSPWDNEKKVGFDPILISLARQRVRGAKKIFSAN
jgi:hypothetical protein